MKNDILLFAVMFAVAWIGFSALKDHLKLPVTDNAVPTANDPRNNNLVAGMTKSGSSDDAVSQSVQQINAQAKATKSDQTNQKASEANVDAASMQSPEQAIEKVLMDQIKAWNRGDLDDFMTAYWNDENLTLSNAEGTTTGFENTYTDYRDRYPDGQMGQIQFTDLKTEMVGKESAIVTGRFDHQLSNEDVHGNFSLVLKSFDGQWKIIHDHTSVAK